MQSFYSTDRSLFIKDLDLPVEQLSLHELSTTIARLSGLLITSFATLEETDIKVITSDIRHLATQAAQFVGIEKYITPDSFALDDVIKTILLEVFDITNSKGIELYFEANPEAQISADQDAILSVIQKLMFYFINLTPKTQTIKVSSKIVDEMVEVSISNSQFSDPRINGSSVQKHHLYYPDIVLSSDFLNSCRLLKQNKGTLTVTSEEFIVFSLSLPHSHSIL